MTISKDSGRPNYAYRPKRDVLSGRGEYFKQNNRFFRSLVNDFVPLYDKSCTNAEKRTIASKVIGLVHDNGGRFLDDHGVEMSKLLAVRKTMKALKDRRFYQAKSTSSPKNSKAPTKQCTKENATKASPVVSSTVAVESVLPSRQGEVNATPSSSKSSEAKSNVTTKECDARVPSLVQLQMNAYKLPNLSALSSAAPFPELVESDTLRLPCKREDRLELQDISEDSEWYWNESLSEQAEDELLSEVLDGPRLFQNISTDVFRMAV